MATNFNLDERFKKAAEDNLNQRKPVNLMVRVDKYHCNAEDVNEHFVEGTVVDPKSNYFEKTVRVKLLKDDNKPEQLTLADYQNSKNSYHVWSSEQGKNQKAGVIMFENCTNLGESFAARFVHPMIHDSSQQNQNLSSGYCSIILRAGQIDPITGEKQDNTAFLRQAETSKAKAFSFDEVDKLYDYISESMIVEEGKGSYRPEAIVRLVNLTEEDPSANATIITAPFIKTDEDELGRLATPEEALESFKTVVMDGEINKTKISNTYFQMIVEMATANQGTDMNDAFLEVIPVTRRNIKTRSTTQDSLFMMNEEGSKNEISNYGKALLGKFNKKTMVVDNDTNEARPKYLHLWVPATFNTVNAKNDENGDAVDYKFIGQVATTEVFPSGYNVDYIPTSNFTNPNQRKAVYGSDAIAVNQAKRELAEKSKTQAAPPTPQQTPVTSKAPVTKKENSKPAAQKSAPKAQEPNPKAKAHLKSHTQKQETKPDLSGNFEELVDTKPVANTTQTTKSAPEPELETTTESHAAQSDANAIDDLISSEINDLTEAEIDVDEDEAALLNELFAENNMSMN